MADPKLTAVEQEKAAILTQAIAGEITNAQAAKQLGLSVRQVQRAKAKIRTEGVKSVIHKLKGKPSNHRYAEVLKLQTINTVKKHYKDFKPTFATEKLSETHDVHISRETVRLWMIENGLWKAKTQKRPQYRSWRPRKDYFGELQQFDGSYHCWFETRYIDKNGNPIEVCLLASIDDATGHITKAQFAPNEGVVAVLTFWQEYVKETGKPLSIYLDKFSTYKINHKSAVDNFALMTQFERAMQSLDVQLISAHSPEAKGRIERLFGTLQDRLVKEMRLAGINTPDQGNIFLQEVFLPKFNAKFSVVAVKEGNVHKALTIQDRRNLSSIFSIHSQRRVNNNYTIQFKNTWYQLLELQPTTVRPKDKVTMQEWLDKTLHIVFKNHILAYKQLPQKPLKISTQPPIITTHKLNWQPPKNHPWRKFKYGKG